MYIRPKFSNSLFFQSPSILLAYLSCSLKSLLFYTSRRFSVALSLSLLISALCSDLFGARQAQIVIHCTSQTIEGHTDLLRDSLNQPLSAGNNANGDGDLVTLGYYSMSDSSSIANHFNGDWIPLTEGTRIGDSSSGYGFGNGMFSFTSVFTFNSDTIGIFPYEPAFFELSSPHVITNSAPPPGKPLCIRFHDSNSISKDTKYNAVTGAQWLWPTFSGGIPENLYLKVSSGSPSANSVWKYGSTLKYPSNSFQTTEPVEYIPNLYSLTLNHTSGGTVNDVNASYPEDSSVELLATPNAHMEFLGWLGDGVSDPLFPNTVVFMTEDRNITAVFEPKKYQLQINVSGVGDVTGEDEYSYGGNAAITATPSLGYEFSHWIGDGVDANTTSTFVQITRDQTIEAVFLPKQHTFTVSSFIESQGSTSIVQSPPYRNGNFYDIIAEPNSGYRFSHWSSTNGALYMLDSNLTATTRVRLSDDALLFAHFEEIQYRLDILMGNGGASVTPTSALFGVNQSIAVNATPAEGYQFSKWQDPSGLLEDSFTAATSVVMSRANGNSFIQAQFERKVYDVKITSGNGGNIIFDTPNGPWMHFGIYAIQAVPNPGYKFVSWNGNQESINSLLVSNEQPSNQISVSSNISLNAHFVPESYSISVTSGEGGSATGSGQFSVSDSPALVANAAIGWEFSHWDGNETLLTLLSSNTSPNAFVNLTEAPPLLNFEAVFRRSQFEINVQASSGGNVNGQSSLSYQIESGSELTLIANPEIGWEFSRWFGIESDSPTDSSLSILVNGNLNVTAEFEQKSYLLSINPSPNGEVSGGGSYGYNSDIPITATPKQGYRFLRWAGDIEFIQSTVNAITTVKMPDASVTIEPVFEVTPIKVTASVIGYGSVTGTGEYNPNETFSIEALGDSPTGTAPRGFGLLKWTWSDENGQYHSSTDNPLVLSSANDIHIDVEFYPIPPEEVDVSISSNPSGAGIIYDDPDSRVWNIDKDTIDRSITVTTQPGFSFLGWSSSADVDISPHWKSDQITASPFADSSIVAHFKPLTHKFDVTYNPQMGSISEFKKSYAHGETFVIKAEANKHFKFSGWNLSKLHTFNVSHGSSSVRSAENILLIDNLETPEIPLVRGHTYNFEINLPSNLEFFISSNSPVSTTFDHEYTMGIQNSRVSTGTLVFKVPEDAPDYLYYTTSSNTVTGGKFKILTLNESDILAFPEEAYISPTSLLDFSITANFVDESYKINVSAGTGGSVDAVSSDFTFQDVVNLTATPDEHYQFVSWEGSEHIEDKNLPNSKLTVNETTNIKAVFTPILYPLNISSAPTDTASFITSNNKLSFAFGETVEIKAIPKSGFKFLEWTGDINSQNSSTQLVMNGPQSIVAKIATQPVNVNLSARSLNYLDMIDSNLIGGSVEGPSIIQKNELASFTAEPREGFDFLGWFNEENQTIASTLNTTLALLEDSVITAVFREKSYELQVDVQPKYFGTLEWEDDVSLKQINTRLPYGHQVEITANPLNQNRFEKWFYNSSEKIDVNENNLFFTIRDDTRISAKFLEAPIPFLTINMNPQNAGKVVGSGQRSKNEAHYIFASANEGYEFVKWEGAGIKSPYDETTSISFETNTVITAVFSKEDNNGGDDGNTSNDNLFSLSVSPSNPNHGLTNPSLKNYYAKGKVPILAKPKPGYIFSHWEGESISDPLSSSTEVNLENDLLIAAIFESISHNQKQINITHVIETLDYLGNPSKNEIKGGTILGGTSFLNDHTPTFKAYAKDAYRFLRWENGFGQILSTNEEITYKSATDFTLKAIFQKKSYNVNVFTQPGNKTEILWEGYGKASKHKQLVPHGEQISLNALQGINYQFLNWQTNGIFIQNPRDLKINLTIQSEAILTAIYYPTNEVVVTTSIYPESGGWILGGGKNSYNPMHPLHAKANNGFKFVRWEGSQILDPSSPQTTVNLDQNLDIRAIFEPDLLYEGDPTTSIPGLHIVEVLSADPDRGAVTGSGVYGPGWVDIEAVANYGFEFSHWDSLAVADPKASKTKLLVEDHSTATAYFKEKTLVINSIPEGNSWYSNNWFGTYWNEKRSPWAFHLILGWIFAHENSNQSYWVWINNLDGWYWLEAESFPYLFESSSNAWVFLSTETSSPAEIFLFKFKDNRWRRLKQ